MVNSVIWRTDCKSALAGIVPEQQYEDIQGITSMHEIGGHAYYHQQGVMEKENNKKTEQFERKARDTYRGKYLPNYIKKQEAIKH